MGKAKPTKAQVKARKKATEETLSYLASQGSAAAAAALAAKAKEEAEKK